MSVPAKTVEMFCEICGFPDVSCEKWGEGACPRCGTEYEWAEAYVVKLSEEQKREKELMNRDFVKHVANIRKEAVDRFLRDYKMTREEWDEMTWDGWAKVPVFKAMELYPLGGSIRFTGHELEVVSYAFQNRKTGKLFGVTVDVKGRRLWTGSISTSKGDANDAAREAITGLLELMYLRSTQS